MPRIKPSQKYLKTAIMKKTFLYPLFLLAITAALVSCKGNKDNSNDNGKTEAAQEQEAVEPRTIEYGVDVTDLSVVHGKIKSGQIITSLLRNLNADANAITRAAFIPDSVFNVRNIRAGNGYSAYYTQDSVPELVYLVYSHSLVDYVVFHVKDSLRVERYRKPTTIVNRTAYATITSSLWNAIDEAGLNLQLALDLSDIFAWTVDFFGLQSGDNFKIWFDEEFVDSISIGIPKIYAACFTRNNDSKYALFFENEEVSGYWEPNGDNIKKAFLKAPLSFSRISSHFSYARKHPVYKTVRPHLGVDYAAPMGTPVMSIGDGVVIAKGYRGGGGHTVKIRHNSTYTTAYLHLSKYGKGIAVGERVSQGQVIGYVGSSGTSTGAHLDFRVWKNGQPVNPLAIESPPTEPIPAKYMADFDSVKTIMISKLDSIKGTSIDCFAGDL